MQQIQLTENIYYVGVNDRHTDMFENHMELPNGVSYNSYLIVDDTSTPACEQVGTAPAGGGSLNMQR